jgi:DnaJ-class molecular chaperone
MSKEELYTILEIPKTATDDEIKKAYKKAALKHHPDRNPNNPEATAKFQEVGKAFATLSDPQKRQRYDQFGVIDGENDGPGGGGGMPPGFNPFDMFQNMFGGGGGGGGFPGFPGFPGMNMNQQNNNNQNRAFKSPDKKVTINLSLADVYKGKSVSIDFNKIVCCDKCHGCGALSKEHIQTCKTCNGQGKVMKMVQMGPMIQQSIQHCSHCKGIGKMIEQGKNCIKCNGQKTMTIKKHLDCYVRPGSAPGTSISFKNESDWVPDCSDVGDLIVFVNCKNEEDIFRREGNNLIMKKSISLLEALTNTIFYFKHLDDRVIRIKHNEIIKPNQKMIVKGEGMPNINGGDTGDLLIYFDIIFPDTLDQDRSKYLVKILPLPKKQIWDLQLESVPEHNITDKIMYNYDDKTNSKDNTQKTETIFTDINNVLNDDDIFNDDNSNNNTNGNRMPTMGGRQQVECATQ